MSVYISCCRLRKDFYYRIGRHTNRSNTQSTIIRNDPQNIQNEQNSKPFLLPQHLYYHSSKTYLINLNA